MTVKFTKLGNGFTIATEFMPNFKTASIGVWIKVGGRHENKKQNGIAHFLEHMAFKGTKKRSSLEIAEEIETVGGYMNAYTSREMTNYYCRILSQDAGLALDVISDIVLHSTIRAEEVDLERNVILQEIGQTNDTPDDIIFDWLQEVCYPKQPIGRSILGSIENVRNFNRQDLLAFTRKNYKPNKMILCATGDIDHDNIVAKAENYFAHLSKAEDVLLQKAKFVGGEIRVEKPLEQAHFAISFEAPSVKSKDIFTSQIFSVIMGGGMSSRLFQEIREKRGLCYTIYSSLEALEDTGSITVYAGTSEEKVLELANVVSDEIKRASDTITVKELERSRSQIKAGMLMGLESTASRSERLARTISVWDRVVSIDETIAKIDNVSLDDLQSYSYSLCTSGKLGLALYGPVSNAPSSEELISRLSS